MLILAVDTSTRTGSAAILRDTEVLAEVSGYEETPYSIAAFSRYCPAARQGKLPHGPNRCLRGCGRPGLVYGAASRIDGGESLGGGPRKTHRSDQWVGGDRRGIAGWRSYKRFKAPFIAPFLDARRGQIFGAIYQQEFGDASPLELASDESILSAGRISGTWLRKNRPSSIQLVSPTPDVLPAARLEEILPGARIVQVSAALAPAIGRLGFERAKRGDLVDSIRLDANYVRRSDAESAWKDG